MKTAWNENMRIFRERFKYSQKELAEKLNISERTLQRYENGISEPTISILLELSKIYEVSIDAIVGNEYYATTDPARYEKYIKDIEKICTNFRYAIYEYE